MPCREWFEKQSRSYQDKVLPPAVRARVSVEAGISMGWHDVVGDAGRIVSIEHFGASADQATLYREFGITADAVVKAAKDSIKAAGAPRPGPRGSPRPTRPAPPRARPPTSWVATRRRQRQGRRRGSRIRYEQGEVTSMTNPNTQALSDAGVSIWLDDLSRELIETGKISELITERNVVGVTSNPSIFQAALSKASATTTTWPR